MKVKIMKLYEDAIIPTRGSNQAAGYDLYASNEDYYRINPHETVRISTGIAIEIPEGYFGAVYARSGLSTKEGLRPANCVGVVDSDYRGEVFVYLHNDSNLTKFVNKCERIAQLVIMPYLPIEFEEVEELSSTKRGDNGFGSTGK